MKNIETHEKIIKKNNSAFLLTEGTTSLNCSIPPLDFFKNEYTNSLELLHGIREKKSLKLRDSGINRLNDAVLSGDNPLKRNAEKALNALKNGFNSVKKMLKTRFSSSHPLFFLLLSYFNKEDLLFIDIETKGLHFETSIIEIGAGFFKNNFFKTLQFTALDSGGEYEILKKFESITSEKKCFVTFNGKSFDIPFIESRMGYYGINNPDIAGIHNFDLLHFSRAAFKNKLPSFNLKTIEKHILLLERNSDIEGKDVEYYYNRYMRCGNPKFLEPIIFHNRSDIISLALLTEKLRQNWTK